MVKKEKFKKGSALVFAVIVLFVILTVVISLSSITILETKMSQKTKSSTGAFFNADSGVEWALYKIANTPFNDIESTFSPLVMDPNGRINCPAELGGGNVCGIYFIKSDGSVITTNETIDQIVSVRSVGVQDANTARAIEAAVAAGSGWVDDGTSVRLEVPTDNVGVGTTNPSVKLEVDGIIRTVPRSSDPTCNASSEGGVYYNSSTDNFFGCANGTWKRLDN